MENPSDLRKVTVVTGKHSSAYSRRRGFLDGISGGKIPLFYIFEGGFNLGTPDPGIGRKKIGYRITVFNVVNQICYGNFGTFNDVFSFCFHRLILLYLDNYRKDHGAAVGAVEEEVFQNVNNYLAGVAVGINMAFLFDKSIFDLGGGFG